MSHVLAVICWAAAWCCASVSAAGGWSAIRTGATWAAGWMVAGALAGAGFVLIGVTLW